MIGPGVAGVVLSAGKYIALANYGRRATAVAGPILPRYGWLSKLVPFGDPKRDHNFDNHPYSAQPEAKVFKLHLKPGILHRRNYFMVGIGLKM